LRRPLLVQTGLGVGDVLLVTALTRRWAKEGRRPLLVETRYPELFLHSPDVMFVATDGVVRRWTSTGAERRLVWRFGSAVARAVNAIAVRPSYPFPCPGRHILRAMADSVGLALGGKDAAPVLYISNSERVDALQHRGAVVVQSSSASYWTPNKSWVPGRMQLVVDGLRSHGYRIIQLGAADDDPLVGVSDLRGKTNLRQAATILAGGALLVGLEGGLVHLARAVGTPAVVVYTGYTLPQETGYPENINIRAGEAQDSCWRRDPCEHCRASAQAVTAEDVLLAAKTTLQTVDADRLGNQQRV